MIGYNPNRDSGIAEARSYIEIEKPDLAGLQEYGWVPDATQRYFAQLVYNVGNTGQQFTASQISGLLEILEKKNEIIGLAETSAIETLIINISDFVFENTNVNGTINATRMLLPAIKLEDSEQYQLVQDIEDFDGDNNTVEYLLHIPGYVCSVESYYWVTDGIVSEQTDKILVTTTYLTKKNMQEKYGLDYPAGRTTIYFDKSNLEQIQALPLANQIIKVNYLVLPSKAI